MRRRRLYVYVLMVVLMVILSYSQLDSAQRVSATQAGCAQAPARLLDLPLGRSLRSYGTPSRDAHHGIHRSGIC